MEVETNPYRGFNKINTNYGVRGAADLSFQMVPDAQGNQVPLILPIYRSTSTDLTPLIIAGTLLAGGLYFGPGATAGAAGTGAATGATAGTAAGAGCCYRCCYCGNARCIYYLHGCGSVYRSLYVSTTSYWRNWQSVSGRCSVSIWWRTPFPQQQPFQQGNLLTPL
jgi:hypothetical protein